MTDALDRPTGSAPMEAVSLAYDLALRYLSKPKGTERIARELGLWETLVGVLAEILQVEHSRRDPSEFIEYAIKDNTTGDPIVLAEFHREWQAMLAEMGNTLVMGPRGHGKCNVAGTLLQMPDGSKRAVETIPLGSSFECLSWDARRGFTYQNARVFADTVQPCVEIQTKSGRTTRYSVEHPCWTENGWVEASRVEVGQRFAVARNAPVGTVKACPYRAYLLGALLGDGGLSVRTRISITLGDPAVEARVREACDKAGFLLSPLVKGSRYGYNLSANARRWVESLGLLGTYSGTKFVPAEVFTWDREALSAFIEGYFDTDGCVSPQSRVIEFSSINRPMLEAIQSLLLRLGVVSAIRVKNGRYKDEPHLSYRLQIAGGSNAAFGALLTSDTERARRAHVIQNQSFDNANIDLIPDAVIDRLKVGRGAKSDKKDGCDLSNRRIRGQSRRKVQILAVKQGRNDLYNEADLFWDEIISVRDIGEQQTYSVEVEDTHVHVTDDFITHNSINVSARIVWELGKNSRLRIKIVCSTDKAAKELLNLAYIQITTNALVRKVFPHLQINKSMPDTSEAFSVVRDDPARDSSVTAAGVFTSGAGGRADILVCDDVCDEPNSVLNPSDREKVISTLQNVWFALMSNKSRLWWLCTPYHVKDASHVFMRGAPNIPPMFDRKWREPAIKPGIVRDNEGLPVLDPEGKPYPTETILWPEYWPKEALDTKLRTLGPLAFARQYLLKVQADTDLFFPKKTVLMPSYEPSLWRIGQAIPLEGRDGDIPDDWPTFGGIDLASSLTDRGAFFVIWTLAYSVESRRLYFKELVRQKAVFHEIIDEIAAANRRHRWEFAYVENNAFQKAVETQLARDHQHIPIQGTHTGINKNSESVGLRGLATAFSKGLFAIPSRDLEGIPENDPTPLGVFWNEITAYPGAEFSDTLMGLWFAWRAFIDGWDPITQDYSALVSAA